MKYFVTGGAGFIGSNYVEMLLESTPDVSAVTIFDAFTYAANPKNYSKFIDDKRLKIIKGDICDLSSLSESMADHDFVINFAAESHVDRSIKESEVFINTNILGTRNVLESAKLNKIATVIQVSTDEVYGSMFKGSANEESLLQPNSPYAASKASADLISRSYFITHGVDVRITRSCNNYGKYQFPEKVIPLFIKQLILGKKIPIYGSGENIREWIHVSENCKGIQIVLERGDPGGIYNIGSGQSLNNNDLASLIINKMNLSQNHKRYVEDRLGHDYRYSINSNKIKQIGFQQLINFEIGITETIDWYLQNQSWLDMDSQK